MTVVSDAPARAQGLQLIGEMQGSGYRVPPALVRRQDGQTVQLTPLLYAVLEAVDGQRTPDAIADHVSRRTGRAVSADNVETLMREKLRPLGLLTDVDGSQPVVAKSNPLLALRAKVAVTDPRRTRRLTDPFARLFHPVVWIPVTAAFLAVAWWLLMAKGLASATYEVFQRPGLLLLVFAVTVLSAGFHEFGHAAAARRGGAQPGVMGAGVYLVWPAFYTDVTDSYRLGRVGRLRTDLGGLYFNAIVAVGITGLWWATRWDGLLIVVAAQVVQMVRQLTPLVRFDGYHVLADLTGVPDLFGRIGPILASLLPGRRTDPRVTALKPWARGVVTTWVLVTVPLLVAMLVLMVLALPRLVGTAVASVRREWAVAGDAFGSGQVVDGLAAALAMVAYAFPILAIGVLLWRLGRSLALGAWRATRGRPVRRGLAALLALALVAGLAWAWWPDPDRYRPVLPFEDGTVTSALATPLARVGLTLPGSDPVLTGGRAQTVLPAGTDLAGEERPVPALVMVPRSPDGTPMTDPGAAGGDPSDAPTWVFPFDRPLPPDPGDNQAMAVNTTDGSVVYDIAFAMVWADGDQVLNENEAYAFASCQDCATVAVAFQVVVILGQADVVVPQNKAAAVNYECYSCITAAVASQLVLTLEAEPGEEQQVALTELWAEIAAFAATIPQLSLAEITANLELYQDRIKEILQGGDESSGETAESEPSSSPSGSPTSDSSDSSEDGSEDGTESSSDGSSEEGASSDGESGSEGTQSSPSPSSSPGSGSGSAGPTAETSAGPSDEPSDEPSDGSSTSPTSRAGSSPTTSQP